MRGFMVHYRVQIKGGIRASSAAVLKEMRNAYKIEVVNAEEDRGWRMEN
jgi:hypothetical protein